MSREIDNVHSKGKITEDMIPDILASVTQILDEGFEIQTQNNWERLKELLGFLPEPPDGFMPRLILKWTPHLKNWIPWNELASDPENKHLYYRFRRADNCRKKLYDYFDMRRKKGQKISPSKVLKMVKRTNLEKDIWESQCPSGTNFDMHDVYLCAQVDALNTLSLHGANNGLATTYEDAYRQERAIEKPIQNLQILNSSLRVHINNSHPVKRRNMP